MKESAGRAARLLFVLLLPQSVFAYDPSVAQRRDHAAYVASFMSDAAYSVRRCMRARVQQEMRYAGADRERAINAALGCADSYITNAIAYGYRSPARARSETAAWALAAYREELRQGQ
jgi:hypothetical protein